jgi:lipoprotein signal peptidase
MNQIKNNDGNGIGIGAALGLAFGFLYGSQSGNKSISIAFGLAIGAAFGAIIDIIRNQKTTTFIYKYRKEIIVGLLVFLIILFKDIIKSF